MRDMLKKQIVYISDQTHEEKFLEEYILEEYILENNIASARDVGSCPRLLTELIRCEQDALEQNATLCTDNDADDDDDDADDDDDDDDDILDSQPQMFGPRRASYFCTQAWGRPRKRA